jgi:hypothetical protein
MSLESMASTGFVDYDNHDSFSATWTICYRHGMERVVPACLANRNWQRGNGNIQRGREYLLKLEIPPQWQ